MTTDKDLQRDAALRIARRLDQMIATCRAHGLVMRALPSGEVRIEAQGKALACTTERMEGEHGSGDC